jgi:HEPN domain
MVDHAMRLLADAEILQQSPRVASDGGYLLRLLAFETLLKALLRAYGVDPPKNHSYLELFRLLPEPVQERVLAGAVTRMSGSADYSNVPELLDTFATNFVALRYPYEAYELVSKVGRVSAGLGWIAKGGPDSEATFLYHPEELYGLTHSLTGELKGWLSSTAPE